MATHFSILAWKISWTEKTSGLQSMRSQKSQTWLSNSTTTILRMISLKTFTNFIGEKSLIAFIWNQFFPQTWSLLHLPKVSMEILSHRNRILRVPVFILIRYDKTCGHGNGCHERSLLYPEIPRNRRPGMPYKGQLGKMTESVRITQEAEEMRKTWTGDSPVISTGRQGELV